MNKITKPADRVNGQTGFAGVTDGVVNCLNPTTSPLKIQLFGTFDHDTKNAIIVTAREVSGE